MRAPWLLLAAAVALPARCPRPPLRVATFNVEDFPRDDRQVEGAFAEIRRTTAPVVALQEITDPAVLAAAARAELGEGWRALTTTGDHHRLGLLYDAGRVEVRSVVVREETRVVPGARPALDAELVVDGRPLRVVTVHLKAGGRSQVPVRALQLARLGELLVDEDGPVVVLGDFNTSTDADRAAVAALAHATRLTWASEDLGCTALWEEDRAGCVGRALDHVLSATPATVTVGAACAAGCPPADRCPRWRHEVSDHCPVVVELR